MQVNEEDAEKPAFKCCNDCLGTGELYPHEDRDDNGDCPICEGLGMIEIDPPE